MPLYRYAGYSIDGSTVKGKIEASSPQEASSKLKDLGIFLRHIRPEERPKRYGRHNLTHITRQLSTLLGAGVPLTEALKGIASEQASSMANILNAILERVSSGASLSKALEEHRTVFPDFYINMVSAAELSGELPQVLEKIALYLESQDAIKARLRLSMVYPSVMLLVAGAVLFFIFLYVMPRIVKIFEDTRAPLPLITKVLIALTVFLKHFWFIIPLLVIGVFYGLRYIQKRYPNLIDRLLLKEPLGILLPLYISRFTKTLAFMLEGGVPMIKALEVSARSTGNRIMESEILKAKRAVQEGGRLSQNLESFPPVVIELISNGEKSGRLTENLKTASRVYEEEFSRRLSTALSLLEPAMIIVMGIVVLFVVLGIVLPIFELNQLIRF